MKDILYTAKLILKRKFETVLLASSPEDILKILKKSVVDIILLDMNFGLGRTSGNEGIFWLREVLKNYPDQHIIIILPMVISKWLLKP